jgi:hypothetical protein
MASRETDVRMLLAEPLHSLDFRSSEPDIQGKGYTGGQNDEVSLQHRRA